MRERNLILYHCVITFILIFFAQPVFAADIPPPLYKTTPPERKKVIEEDVYFYSVMQYDPPVEITPLKKSDKKSYKTPEEAVISQVSAMFNRDYEWWIKGWSKESQKMMKERDRSLKRPPDFWVKKWDEVMKDKKGELVYRIESGPYVIIEYHLITLISGKPVKDSEEKDNENPPLFSRGGTGGLFSDEPIEGTMVFKNENGKWLATQEMGADPVLLNWKSPERRIQRVVRDK